MCKTPSKMHKHDMLKIGSFRDRTKRGGGGGVKVPTPPPRPEVCLKYHRSDMVKTASAEM